MSNNNQMLAIWGSPNSGKTATAVKLALELAANKKNVVILMCNFIAPAPQTLMPAISMDGKSLGELLSLPSISQDIILSRCIPLGRIPYISLLGYKRGDNCFSYAKYSKERAVDFITLLRHVADYIIIDCDSAFPFDVLSTVALEIADVVLRLCPCDLKSLSYFSSALPLLGDSRYASARHIKILSMIKPGQDSGAYLNTYGDISYSLPFMPEIEEQFNAAQLMNELSTKESKSYNTAICAIAHKALLNDETAEDGKKMLSFSRKEKPKNEKTVKKTPLKEHTRSIPPLQSINSGEVNNNGGIFAKLKLRIGKGGPHNG